MNRRAGITGAEFAQKNSIDGVKRDLLFLFHVLCVLSVRSVNLWEILVVCGVLLVASLATASVRQKSQAESLDA